MENMDCKSKKDRLDAIRKIVSGKAVSSQDELNDELASIGFCVTQATLSRDLRELGIIKVPAGNGGYRYSLHEPLDMQSATISGSIPREGVKSIGFSSRLAVIKTYPGFAGAVASVIDRHPSAPVLGTIAGDDTVLLIIRDNYTDRQVIEAVSACLPGIKELNDTESK